jgi:hypothetical protein
MRAPRDGSPPQPPPPRSAPSRPGQARAAAPRRARAAARRALSQTAQTAGGRTWVLGGAPRGRRPRPRRRSRSRARSSPGAAPPCRHAGRAARQPGGRGAGPLPRAEGCGRRTRAAPRPAARARCAKMRFAARGGGSRSRPWSHFLRPASRSLRAPGSARPTRWRLRVVLRQGEGASARVRGSRGGDARASETGHHDIHSALKRR